MAVAADFHRNFLIPEHPIVWDARQQMQKHLMICVYSFVDFYYSITA